MLNAHNQPICYVNDCLVSSVFFLHIFSLSVYLPVSGRCFKANNSILNVLFFVACPYLYLISECSFAHVFDRNHHIRMSILPFFSFIIVSNFSLLLCILLCMCFFYYLNCLLAVIVVGIQICYV